jgi:hypothetical protein
MSQKPISPAAFGAVRHPNVGLSQPRTSTDLHGREGRRDRFGHRHLISRRPGHVAPHGIGEPGRAPARAIVSHVIDPVVARPWSVRISRPAWSRSTKVRKIICRTVEGVMPTCAQAVFEARQKSNTRECCSHGQVEPRECGRGSGRVGRILAHTMSSQSSRPMRSPKVIAPSRGMGGSLPESRKRKHAEQHHRVGLFDRPRAPRMACPKSGLPPIPAELLQSSEMTRCAIADLSGTSGLRAHHVV